MDGCSFVTRASLRNKRSFVKGMLPVSTVFLTDFNKRRFFCAKHYSSQAYVMSIIIEVSTKLYFVGISLEPPPKDKWHFVFITLIFQGIATLTAWDMFIMAKQYFVEYKLSNSVYAGTFLSCLGLASNLPNVCFSWLNVFIKLGGNLTVRIVLSLTIEILIFLFTVVMAVVDSSQWPDVFFWITMLSVFLLCSCNAIHQNSVYGVASCLPPKYTGAIVLGSNLCGTLVVLLGWTSDTISGNLKNSAIYYFATGMLALFVCLISYYAMLLNKFFSYHTKQQQNLPQQQKTPYRTIFKQSRVQLYNIWVVYFVTLSIFPVVHSDIQSENGLFGVNFMRITCFLTYTLSALIGSTTATFVNFPRQKWLWVLTTLRLVFIPFFLLCNYRPKQNGAMIPRKLPVLIHNDAVYWVGGVLMGWSSGHASSLGLMYVSRTVAPENAAKAAMIGAAMLMTGIFSGVGFSFIAPKIV